MVRLRDDIVGLDSAIIQSPQVWEASGSPDAVQRSAGGMHERATPGTGSTSSTTRNNARLVARAGTFTEPKDFNLMFKTHMGPIASRGQRRVSPSGDRSGHIHEL